MCNLERCLKVTSSISNPLNCMNTDGKRVYQNLQKQKTFKLLQKHWLLFTAVKHNCLITDGITPQRDIFYTIFEVVNRSVRVFHFHTCSDVLLPQSELSERGSAGSPSGRKKQGRTCRGEVSLQCVSPCESAAPPSGWKPCRNVSTCRAFHLMRRSTKQRSRSCNEDARNSTTST